MKENNSGQFMLPQINSQANLINKNKLTEFDEVINQRRQQLLAADQAYGGKQLQNQANQKPLKNMRSLKNLQYQNKNLLNNNGGLTLPKHNMSMPGLRHIPISARNNIFENDLAGKENGIREAQTPRVLNNVQDHQ